MTDQTNAASGGELEPAPVVSAGNLFEALDGDSYSVEDALASRSAKNTPAESAETATAETESEAKADDAAPEGTTAEDQEAEPEAPAIDPPKSWSKEAHERWSKLDRETQEFLAARDSEDQKAIKRNLQEAADARKAAEADQAQWKQERESYVQKQAAYTQALETTLQNQFGDIQTMADVEKMQAEDPFRFQQWQLHQMRLGQAKAEQQANEQRGLQERQQSWAKFVQEESKAFSDEVPEFKAKEAEYTKRAAEVLGELGFTDSELNKLASGEEKISIYDRRMQRLLFDRIRLSEIKAAPPKAIPKPVPAVQKPGVAAPKGAQASENVQALRNKLSGSGSVEDAFALYQAKKSRASR